MKRELLIEGLGVEQVLYKLARAHIPLSAARRAQKNALLVTVAAKDSKKVFAILQGSCYNVKKVRPVGVLRLLEGCRRFPGLLLGAALALALVLFCESRVLKVEIAGSGAYYEGEVRAILQEEGVGVFASPPARIALLTSRILMLPRVSFASLSFGGGVLTVRVEVSDEESIFSPAPLKAPQAGILEELVVLRGTPMAEIGQQVERGQTLISERTIYGEWEEKVLVVGYAVLLCPVEGVFEGSKEAAFAAARLAFGEDAELSCEETAEGWRIFGRARVKISSHMQ